MSIKIFKILEVVMYTGVAEYLEFCGLRLRDMRCNALPVGVWLATHQQAEHCNAYLANASHKIQDILPHQYTLLLQGF
jgi:hypothetical protein